MRRPSWYERIKTGPSPEDNSLLELTKELAVQFQTPYRYRQIVWGRLDRYDNRGRVVSTPTFLSKEIVSYPGSLPEAELMLPEYLKGKLSLDEWKVLIALNLVRFKAYNQTRTSRLLGKISLAPRALFFLLLFYIPAAALTRLSDPVIVLPSPIFLIIALWIRRSLRKSLRRREFELDRSVADQLGTEQVSEVLEKVQNLDQKRIPAIPRLFFLSGLIAYWNPSIKERIGELNKQSPLVYPRSSRIPKIGLRGRVITILVGFGVFWVSGLVAGNIYAQGQTTVVCTDTLCSALVIVSTVGILIAIIGGVSVVVWVARRHL